PAGHRRDARGGSAGRGGQCVVRRPPRGEDPLAEVGGGGRGARVLRTVAARPRRVGRRGGTVRGQPLGGAMSRDTGRVLARGKRVLELERDALGDAASRLDDAFAAAVQLIKQAKGRVIVAGIGKSGLIARKIAATMTSTGTPAYFLHPTESVHGDLGIVTDDDVALLLSKSGETQELLPLLEQLTRLGVPCISITSNRESTLARNSRVALDGYVREEACPHDLAPTTST